jgi:hypothetical protein
MIKNDNDNHNNIIPIHNKNFYPFNKINFEMMNNKTDKEIYKKIERVNIKKYNQEITNDLSYSNSLNKFGKNVNKNNCYNVSNGIIHDINININSNEPENENEAINVNQNLPESDDFENLLSLYDKL